MKLALDLGAEAGVNYRRQDLAAEARRFSGGTGVDVVFENIGDPTLWPAAFNCPRFGGRLATVGSHGGGVVPLDAPPSSPLFRSGGLTPTIVGLTPPTKLHLSALGLSCMSKDPSYQRPQRDRGSFSPYSLPMGEH